MNDVSGGVAETRCLSLISGREFLLAVCALSPLSWELDAAKSVRANFAAVPPVSY